jgi:hypothetical protein
MTTLADVAALGAPVMDPRGSNASKKMGILPSRFVLDAEPQACPYIMSTTSGGSGDCAERGERWHAQQG